MLSNVLFVPDLNINLLFCTGSVLKGFKMISSNEKCEFIDMNGIVKAITKRHNKLYKMIFNLEQTLESINTDHICQISEMSISNFINTISICRKI